MSVGIAVDKAALDYAAGQALAAVHRGLLQVGEIKTWADAFSAAELVTMFGYSQDDADRLKSALSVMDQLRTVYLTGTPPGGGAAGDYVLLARRVFGLGV